MKILIITVVVLTLIALINLIKLCSINSDIQQLYNHIDAVHNSFGRLRLTMEFNEKFKYSDEFIKKLMLAQETASFMALNWFNCRDNKIIEEYIININKLLSSCTNIIAEDDDNEQQDISVK